MKACLKSGMSQIVSVTGFGKAHSPRTSAGRSASSAPPWVLNAPLLGGLNLSPEQQLRHGRSSKAPLSHASYSLGDGDVKGGPPGGGIGGGGGNRGGGDGNDDDGESNPGPGPKWWLFCIQAAAAGWAAGCVVFEAGHLLHPPVPPVRTLPPSAKMGLARKAVVQMQHDRLHMSWVRVCPVALWPVRMLCRVLQLFTGTCMQVWVMVAALGAIAVMLTSHHGSHEQDDSLTEEATEDEVHGAAAACEEHSDEDAVPNLDPQLYTACTSVFAIAAARTQSSPLPDLRVMTYRDNVSFHELQRFWASGGTVSPHSADEGTGPMNLCADRVYPIDKRPVSLDSSRHAPPVVKEIGGDTGLVSCNSQLALDKPLQRSRSQHDSDAMSWPSTPHTPDLKGGPRSDLAALGVTASPASAAVEGACGQSSAQVACSGGAAVPESAFASLSSNPGLSMLRQDSEFRSCALKANQTEAAGNGAGNVDAAFKEVVKPDRDVKESQVSVTTENCTKNVPSVELVSVMVDRDRPGTEVKNAACSVDPQAATQHVGDNIPPGAHTSATDTGLLVQCSAGVDATASVPSGHRTDGCGHADVQNPEQDATGSAMEACRASILPESDGNAQEPSTLNLWSLPPMAMEPVPKPVLMLAELSEATEPDAASPERAPLSERSCIKGGLDTTSSTVFPQSSWQIPDDIKIVANPSCTPEVFAEDCTSSKKASSDDLQSPQQRSACGTVSDVSFGSSGSPSFMSFPSEQNQVNLFKWD